MAAPGPGSEPARAEPPQTRRRSQLAPPAPRGTVDPAARPCAPWYRARAAASHGLAGRAGRLARPLFGPPGRWVPHESRLLTGSTPARGPGLRLGPRDLHGHLPAGAAAALRSAAPPRNGRRP